MHDHVYKCITQKTTLLFSVYSSVFPKIVCRLLCPLRWCLNRGTSWRSRTTLGCFFIFLGWTVFIIRSTEAISIRMLACLQGNFLQTLFSPSLVSPERGANRLGVVASTVAAGYSNSKRVQESRQGIIVIISADSLSDLSFTALIERSTKQKTREFAFLCKMRFSECRYSLNIIVSSIPSLFVDEVYGVIPR